MDKNIPVVILCGGAGTRLAEITDVIPKPLVEVGGKPLLWHIMKHYAKFGFNEFYLALGYKGDQIKRYFLEFHLMNKDFCISLNNGKITILNDNEEEDWKVHLIDTGRDTLTGGRLKYLAHYLNRGTFMMTYGDGVSNVDINRLLDFHYQNGGLVTLTAVRSPARFGSLEFEGNTITFFKEKSTLAEGWINGGFFVIEPGAMDYIKGNVMWEHGPMEQLARERKMIAYKHEGFWQCVDTLRDLRYLESLWDSGSPPWKIW